MNKEIQKPFIKGFKYPIYPNKEQKDLLERTFGCCRYVWNRCLDESIQEFKKYKEKIDLGIDGIKKPEVSGHYFSSKLPLYKLEEDSLWLSEVSSVALQQSLLNLGKAYQSFFEGKSMFPKPRKKHHKNSFKLVKGCFNIKNGVFTIAKCKEPIKIVMHRPLPSVPKSCIISRNAIGQYFVNFPCEYSPGKTSGQGTIGIDLGIKDFAVLSTGEKIANPKYYTKAQKKLKRLQQSLCRKKKGSQNREKAKRLVAKQHHRVASMRSNFLHQLSRRLVNENQVIGLEHLRVKNMVRNRCLSKSISDAGWGQFRTYLSYKARESQHCNLVLMDTFYPSSHLCSETGLKLDRKLNLKERSWNCPYCGKIHDRDINAAQNIAKVAVQRFKELTPDSRGAIILANSGY